jgi:DNA-binding NtrC family response regulator
MSQMKKILCSWIGGADWASLESGAEPGPILRTLRDAEWKNIDEVHLLNNYAGKKSVAFKKALSKKTKAKIICKDVKLTSPTDFKEVDEAATELVRSLPAESRLIYLCSPGTYVMSSVWILLAHNAYPATLIEASKEAGVTGLDVPFNISVRDLIDRADKARSGIGRGLRAYAPEFEDIKHDCRAMRDAIERASLLSPRGIAVLLEGEPGTGRSLLARCMHHKSKRRNFLSINCSAYPDEQLEVELFGASRDKAKRGEVTQTRGLLRKSNDSTLYIEEIDTLAPYLQTRLLQEISRTLTGDQNKKRQRLIFSSTRPLNEAVSDGSFRGDLFYRIVEDIIWLPPLRDRGVKDLKLITEALLLRLKRELKDEGADIEKKELDRSAQRVLELFPFKGNIRELESVLVRALVHSKKTIIGKIDIEEALGITRVGGTVDDVLHRALDEKFVLDNVLDEVTRHYLARAKSSTTSLRQAAKALGFKNYQTLANRIKKLEGFDW